MNDNADAGAGPARRSTDDAIDGGHGEVTAWSDPMLVLTAPGGVVAATPESATFAAGDVAVLSASQAVELLAQGHLSSAVKKGAVLFTVGKATDPERPNQETGIKIHAASGSVHSQSQSGATRLTADKAIRIDSTQGVVRITSPKGLLLTAGGAAIDIQPEGITLKAPGNIYLKGAVKVFDGPKSLSRIPPHLPQPGPLAPNAVELTHRYHDTSAVQGANFEAVLADGSRRRGATDSEGKAALSDVPPGTVQVRFEADTRPYAERPLDANPERRARLAATDWNALIAKHR